MISRFARLALLVELLLYLAGSYWLHSIGYAPLRVFAMAVGVAFILRLVVTLGPFLTVLMLRLHDDRRVVGVGFIRAILGEYIAKSLSFTVWQPFEPWLMQADAEPQPGKNVPVLLVHGYLCNRGSWLVMKRLLRERLPNPVYTINLEPPLSRIDDYVPQLEARVAQLVSGSGHANVHLVCHSMGGLVARAWLTRNQSWSKVASISMLGSPHHGTEMARAGIGRNVRQMVRGNPWLAALEGEEAGHSPAVPVISVHSENDNLVYPPESADLPWAANIRIEGVGHVQMQSAAVTADLVAANIRKAEMV